MGPVVDPVDADETVPDRAAVVIIGGGIIGVSTALVLAERGIDTVLCEKGVIAGEQSSRNWGWVRVMGRDLREVPLMLESLRIWDTLDTRVEGETGFRRSGILYIAETEKDLANQSAWLDAARPLGVASRPVGQEALPALLPGLAQNYRGALHTPSDGRAEPQKAAPAIARAARRKGAKIVTRCAVRGIETAAGRVSAVITEKGRIATEAVVIAGGAWSRLLCRGVGLSLPQLKVLNSVCRTAPVDGGPDGAGATSQFAFRKRLDGGYTISGGDTNRHAIVPDSFWFFRHFLPAFRADAEGVRLRLNDRFLEELRQLAPVPLDRAGPFEQTRILDPVPDLRAIGRSVDAMRAAFPRLRDTPVEHIWGGMIDVTPDAVPVISPVDTVPGLVIATGFSGHGFGIGPGAGRLAADLVTGAPPVVDPTAFRFSRFTDGSPIRLAHTV